VRRSLKTDPTPLESIVQEVGGELPYKVYANTLEKHLTDMISNVVPALADVRGGEQILLDISSIIHGKENGKLLKGNHAVVQQGFNQCRRAILGAAADVVCAVTRLISSNLSSMESALLDESCDVEKIIAMLPQAAPINAEFGKLLRKASGKSSKQFFQYYNIMQQIRGALAEVRNTGVLTLANSGAEAQLDLMGEATKAFEELEVKLGSAMPRARFRFDLMSICQACFRPLKDGQDRASQADCAKKTITTDLNQLPVKLGNALLIASMGQEIL